MDDDPSPADVAALPERLYRYNAAVTGCDDGRWLTIVVRDEGGEIQAGLHGWPWGRTGFVDTLWVRADARARGLGTRLLAAVIGELPGWPHDTTRIFLRKQLPDSLVGQ